MKFAVLFLILSIALGAAAVDLGDALLVLLWPSANFAVIAAAYAGLGPRVFAKRPDGTLAPLSVILLFPYLALGWLVWHVARLIKREPPFDTLVEDIYIGRRLLPDEYPPGIASVVDLTCEFPEPRRVRLGRFYRSLPVLDGSVPDSGALQELVREIPHFRGGVYIHCAEGHGRTATAAAALLLLRGDASTPTEAIELVLKRRPRARVNSAQHRALEEFAAAISGGEGSARH
jgi:hypothetical protein